MFQLEQDKKIAELIVENPNCSKYIDLGIDLSKYNSVYLFATENITGLLQAIDFECSSVFTVCSSGDQIFNMLLMGSVNIDAFDINIFTKYYFGLKEAAIRTLSYKEFLNFFFLKKFGYNNCVFADEVIRKIEKNIKREDVRMFWDYLFQKYGGRRLYESDLFVQNYYTKSTYIACNPYLLNEVNYNILKNRLENYELKFYQVDILNDKIPMSNKYDFIYLSNIMDNLVMNSFDEKDELEYVKKVNELVFSYQDHLLLDGRIGVSYLYCCLDDYWTGVLDGKLKSWLLRNKYFESLYELVCFPGISNLRSKFYRDKDGILLFKKKKW